MHDVAPDLVKWAKVIDQTRCIGCHACTTACKSENEVPLSVTRTYVKYVDVGTFPETRRAFQVTRCNQCDHAPCVTACPTSAMFRRPDGIVDFDKSICIGCKACIAACPYDAIFINPDDGAAEKCNFCAHRLDVGLEPACVVVCPVEAILVGDLNDPDSRVSRIVNRDAVSVRRPEKDTRPKLFYKGAHQVTLDPLAARRPDGGLFLWSEQGARNGQITSGGTGGWNSSAAALLSYDVPHSVPWDWRVSLYTWTKGISAGAYLVAFMLVAAGWLPITSPLWTWITPLLAGVFLAATGGLLLWDLEHPERFLYIFTRAQWRSWLVRGAYIIAGFGLVLALHFLGAVLGAPALPRALVAAGVPLALATAAYTAFLFAQAKARDLWQNPLSPLHLVVQAIVLGCASLALIAGFGYRADPVPTALPLMLAAGCVLHLLLVMSDHTLVHVTAHARVAAREMTRGKQRVAFWVGVILVAAGIATPWIGPLAAIPVLIGMLAYEHAFVQAGQEVPLA